MLSFANIASSINGQLIGEDGFMAGVSIDSRRIQQGDIFVAIKGPSFDGHDFIPQAIEKGARAVICQHEVPLPISQIIVNDTRLALAKLAKTYLASLPARVIALTGSCGKTTTKAMLAAIFAAKAPTHATAGTLNNDFGLPLTVLSAKPEHAYLILEMGANHAGEIAYLCDIAKPDIALITNIHPVHIEGFGSIEGIAKAKSEIYQALDSNGTAVINADEKFSVGWIEQFSAHKQLLFSTKTPQTVWAKEIKLDANNQPEFILCHNSEEILIKLPVLGEHNISNAVAAASCAISEGLSLNIIKQGLESANAVDKRLNLYHAKNGATVIDDSYNANPAAFEAAFKVLAQYPGEKVLIMGEMGELGPEAEIYHAKLGQLAREYDISRLYALGELSQHSVQAFGQGARFFQSHQDLITQLQNDITKDMALLVKGSRSMKMERVVNAIVEDNKITC